MTRALSPLFLLLLAACTQAPVTVTLHSLQASGNITFVCQADDGSGLKLDECPDYDLNRRRILGLVTQTTTDEVAIVDLRASAVVDVDPAIPGYSFLRVGARPGAIVSTPGGVASFVGVAGLQKNGVFALPTTCLNAPKMGEPARDLTRWAACSLNSAPGDISVLLDPPSVGDPANPSVRASCASDQPESDPDQSGHPECPADLTKEGGPPGRRKLLVALPDENKLVLLDAQALLDRPAGEFAACAVEASYPLQAQLPSGPVVPMLPDDLKVASGVATSNACLATQYPPASSTAPTPGGMALSGTQLYVADRTLPVVHVLDVSDPCVPVEGPPLLPYSYVDPNRVVTSSRVAVSPLTPMGHQFVYAIDENDQPAASVMVFDVSPLPAPPGTPVDKLPVRGVDTRTPVVFPGAPRQPYSPPDRLAFAAPVRDVSFVMRDFPAVDPVTGVGAFGVSCDPSPLDTTSPAIQYRPNSDFTSGARPVNLRGVFGFAMLTNGQIAITDVEDFDAPCRRPVLANTTAFEDFRGCSKDKGLAPNPDGPDLYFTVDSTPAGVPTVTNESSCNIIEPNRPRAQSLSISSALVGLHAPSLQALPVFSNPDPAAILAAQDQPHMLAVDFPNPDPSMADTPIVAQVNVGAQLYAACDPNQQSPFPCDGSAVTLPNDPRGAIQNSLTLPLIEPRSYAGNAALSLTFEGPVIGARTSGFLQFEGDSWAMRDADASFCASGVEDSQSILSEASELKISAADQPAWATAHADYLQVTGDFLPDDDAYWSRGNGLTCGALIPGSRSSGKQACIDWFGGIDDPSALNSSRELTIVSAFNDHLLVAPRNGNTVEQVNCCFPTGTSYAVRVSHQWVLNGTAGLHDMAADQNGRCVHTAACDPRKKYFRSRAFEVCSPGADGTVAIDDQCAVHSANIGCIGSGGPTDPGQQANECIFENLTSRFAVYRGAQPSIRDMSFTWSTTGGYVPLTMSLASQSTAVNPQAMAYLPDLGYLAVVDGSTLGLSLFDLNSLGLVAPSPFF